MHSSYTGQIAVFGDVKTTIDIKQLEVFILFILYPLKLSDPL